MSTPHSIRTFGNQLLILMSDDTEFLANPAGGSFWVVGGYASAPVEPEPGDGSIFNPWGVGRGDPLDGWESHASYSGGGYDWSGFSGLVYGSDLVAPAAGTLRTSGGSGEYAAGDIGSAGLRSILILDTPVARVKPKSTTLMSGGTREADGPMAAIVFQHQSAFGVAKHYEKAEANLGKVGDSGNNVTHLHVHGLDAAGNRVDFTKFMA